MKEKQFEGKTLLLIDDRPENLDLLISFLEKYDLNIIVATSGEQGLERLQHAKPDIILLDIMMPGVDGFEVCRRLKESDAFSQIPIILMSALDDPVDKVRGLELGAVDYITKPYKVEEVYARVKNQLYIQGLKKQMAEMKMPQSEQTLGQAKHSIRSEDLGPVETERKSRTVLFVEDAPEDRRLLKDFLDNYYYKTLFATNGNDAFEQLKEGKPDIILLDVKLPDIDGFEVCRRLKKSDDYRNIPVIFITALDDSADTVKGLELGAVDYITKPYNSEEVLARISTQIKISRLMQEQEQVNIKLRELDQLKSLFIASMSHELRTPLNSIIGFNGILRMQLKGKLTEKQEDYMERSHNASTHLLALINDIIDISKIEAGAIQVSPVTFILSEVVNEALGQLQSRIDKKGLEVDISVPPELEVFSDRTRVFQCVLNYLSNAVKYTEEGKISLLAKEKDGQLEVVVEDSGLGIREDELPKLFKSFERLSSAEHGNERGTGLGLYITKKLATEFLGGSVAAESQLGVGSKFFLRIPINLQSH